MDQQKAFEITQLIGKLVDRPLGTVGESSNNPIISGDLINLIWRLILGDTPDKDGSPGMVMVLSNYDGYPLIGWQFRKLPMKNVIETVVTALSLIGEQSGVNFLGPLIKTLQAVKDARDLEDASSKNRPV